MYILVFILFFLFGNIIGSFLNVVIYRFGTGRSMVHGHSICMSCGHKLLWYELIPIFSFLIQSGRCRSCASAISHQYPIVEAVTGFVFAILAFHFLPLASYSVFHYAVMLSIYMFLFSLLIVISVYDIRHKIIPDNLVYVFDIIAFISIFINKTSPTPFFVKPDIWIIFSGFILAAPFALIWLLSHGKWMGLGDAKLELGLGSMLGLSLGLSAIFISFWIGSIVSLLTLFFIHKKFNLKTEIPFAPFLILSALIVFLYNIDIISLANVFRL